MQEESTPLDLGIRPNTDCCRATDSCWQKQPEQTCAASARSALAHKSVLSTQACALVPVFELVSLSYTQCRQRSATNVVTFICRKPLGDRSGDRSFSDHDRYTASDCRQWGYATGLRAWHMLGVTGLYNLSCAAGLEKAVPLHDQKSYVLASQMRDRSGVWVCAPLTQ